MVGLALAAMCCGAVVARSPCVCPRHPNPVCGSDGQTYGSACFLQCARSHNPDLTVASEGPCEPPTADPADEEFARPPFDIRQEATSCSCPRKAQPVCGSDDNTYHNPCMLDCARSGNSSLYMNKDGPCDRNHVMQCLHEHDKKLRIDISLS
ncbi:unnamed protein product, partial [Iphiclides podalirius]